MTTSFFKTSKLEGYRQQVSILWPSAYKAITILSSDISVKGGRRRRFETLCRWAIPVIKQSCSSFTVAGAMTTSFFNTGKLEGYRQPVSIEWPRSYEPRALTSAPCRLKGHWPGYPGSFLPLQSRMYLSCFMINIYYAKYNLKPYNVLYFNHF